MAAPSLSRLVSRTLVGSLGLGLLSLGGIPSAKAVNAGTDYLVTPLSGAKFASPFGLLEFTGLPIGKPAAPPDGGTLGLADTVVNRLSSVDPTANSINPVTGLADIGQSTPIEIVGLSLRAQQPVTIAGIVYDVYAGLEKYYGQTTQSGTPSTGVMFIGDDPVAGKTWDSKFTINAVAFLLPQGSGLDTSVDNFVRNTLEGLVPSTIPGSDPYSCQYGSISMYCLKIVKPDFIATDEPWSPTPHVSPDTLVGDNLVNSSAADFFLTGRVVHDTGNGTVHIVDPYPVPAPLPIFGVSAAFSFARRLRIRSQRRLG